MLEPCSLHFTKDQPGVVFNFAELHKAHVLHHWRLIGNPMISQQVEYSDEETVTVANCPL